MYKKRVKIEFEDLNLFIILTIFVISFFISYFTTWIINTFLLFIDYYSNELFQFYFYIWIILGIFLGFISNYFLIEKKESKKVLLFVSLYIIGYYSFLIALFNLYQNLIRFNILSKDIEVIVWLVGVHLSLVLGILFTDYKNSLVEKTKINHFLRGFCLTYDLLTLSFIFFIGRLENPNLHEKFAIIVGFLLSVVVGLANILISELLISQHNLRASEQKYRFIFERVPIGIGTSDLDGNVITSNSKIAEILGYTLDEINMINLKNTFVDPKDRENIIEKLIKEETIENLEVIRKKKDGTLCHTMTSLEILEIAGKSLILSSILDITEKKLAEKEKKELEEQRNRFVQSTSHELSTPVLNIRGVLELLSTNSKMTIDDEQIKLFHIVDRSLKKIERLIFDLSSLSKIERGVFLLNKSVVNIYKVLREEAEGYETLFENEFFYHFPEEATVLIELDIERFSQVLANIIDNAVKNTSDDNRKIILRTIDYPDSIEIIIEDNGAGIKSENLDKIFYQFTTIETKYSTKGSGIGLFLCKTIIEQHNGKIVARSDGIDKGASFHVILPILNG